LNLNGSDTCSEALVQDQASMLASTSHWEMVEPSHCKSKYHISASLRRQTYPPNRLWPYKELLIHPISVFYQKLDTYSAQDTWIFYRHTTSWCME